MADTAQGTTWAERSTSFEVQQNALIDTPVWSKDPKARVWAATLYDNGDSLGRFFWTRARETERPKRYYLPPGLSPGDAVEFAADQFRFFHGAAQRNASRWYGVVSEFVPNRLTLIGAPSAWEAIRLAVTIKESDEHRAPVIEAARQALLRLTPEEAQELVTRMTGAGEWETETNETVTKFITKALQGLSACKKGPDRFEEEALDSIRQRMMRLDLD